MVQQPVVQLKKKARGHGQTKAHVSLFARLKEFYNNYNFSFCRKVDIPFSISAGSFFKNKVNPRRNHSLMPLLILTLPALTLFSYASHVLEFLFCYSQN